MGIALFVAIFLALAIPQAYVGGMPLSVQDFAQNKVWHEAFQPWNSEVMQNLSKDISAYITFAAFLFIGGPSFYFIHRLIKIAIAKIEAKDAEKK